MFPADEQEWTNCPEGRTGRLTRNNCEAFGHITNVFLSSHSLSVDCTRQVYCQEVKCPYVIWSATASVNEMKERTVLLAILTTTRLSQRNKILASSQLAGEYRVKSPNVIDQFYGHPQSPDITNNGQWLRFRAYDELQKEKHDFGDHSERSLDAILSELYHVICRSIR
jgi:hypothetical protein